jgi:hypothetical protein
VLLPVTALFNYLLGTPPALSITTFVEIGVASVIYALVMHYFGGKSQSADSQGQPPSSTRSPLNMPVSAKALKQIAVAGVAVALVVGIGIYVLGDSGSSLGDDNESTKAIELVSHEGIAGETGPVRVKGVIRNNSNRTRGGIKVEVRFLDEAGVQVGNTTTQTSSLEPGKEWRFEVPIVGDSVARYEIDRVTWQ